MSPLDAATAAGADEPASVASTRLDVGALLTFLATLTVAHLTPRLALTSLRQLVVALLRRREWERGIEDLAVTASRQTDPLPLLASVARTVAQIYAHPTPECAAPLERFAEILEAAKCREHCEGISRVTLRRCTEMATHLADAAEAGGLVYGCREHVALNPELPWRPLHDAAGVAPCACGCHRADPATVAGVCPCAPAPESTPALRARVRHLQVRSREALDDLCRARGETQPRATVCDAIAAELAAAEAELARREAPLPAIGERWRLGWYQPGTIVAIDMDFAVFLGDNGIGWRSRLPLVGEWERLPPVGETMAVTTGAEEPRLLCSSGGPCAHHAAGGSQADACTGGAS